MCIRDSNSPVMKVSGRKTSATIEINSARPSISSERRSVSSSCISIARSRTDSSSSAMRAARSAPSRKCNRSSSSSQSSAAPDNWDKDCRCGATKRRKAIARARTRVTSLRVGWMFATSTLSSQSSSASPRLATSGSSPSVIAFRCV